MTEQCNLVWLMKKLSLQLDPGPPWPRQWGPGRLGWPRASRSLGLGREGGAACARRGSKGVSLIRTLGVELNCPAAHADI